MNKIISITFEDIKIGRQNIFSNKPFPFKEQNCPIALAAKRAGLIEPHVALRIVSKNCKDIDLPRKALDFCSDVVKGVNLFPFEFEIEITEKKENL